MMRLFAIAAVFVTALLLLGCPGQDTVPGGQAPGNETGQAVVPEPASNKTPIELIIEAQQQRAELISERPNYLPEVVYQNLPPFPEDFYEIRVLVQYGKLDLEEFGPEYWKQPEWYPNFEGGGVTAMQNPPLDRWGAWGIGMYPSDMLVVTDQGTEFTATTYIYTSWLVQTYQGAGPLVAYPRESAVPYEQTGFRIIQDPEEVKEYFDVSFDPEYLLLGPAFPIFDKDWTQKVSVTVKVKEETPPGNYVIGMNAGAPPEEIDSAWLREYKTKYVTSAFVSTVDRPYFQITVVVTEKGTP